MDEPIMKTFDMEVIRARLAEESFLYSARVVELILQQLANFFANEIQVAYHDGYLAALKWLEAEAESSEPAVKEVIQ